MAEQENLHASHRARLKARFCRQGMEGFEDHNVLELLLFYAVPRCDTNPIAHRLMERYGSLSAVFDAPVEDLVRVEGVGQHAAVLIKMIPALAARYCEDRFSVNKKLPSYEEVGAYLVSHFLGRQTESVFGLFYSSDLKFLDSAREIAQHAILKNASYVVLAHNHPQGIPIASATDLDVTRELRAFLSQMEVRLLDHFIVAEGRFSSLMRDYFESECARILALYQNL